MIRDVKVLIVDSYATLLFLSFFKTFIQGLSDTQPNGPIGRASTLGNIQEKLVTICSQ